MGVPLLEPGVLVSAVSTTGIFRTSWTFDTNWSALNPIADPAFEVSKDGITFYPPLAFYGSANPTLTFTYPPQAFAPIAWRILTTPTGPTWAGKPFHVPQGNVYPYP